MNYASNRLLSQLSQNISISVFEKTLRFVIEFEGNRIPFVIYRPTIHTIDPLIIRDRDVAFKEIPENTFCYKEATDSTKNSYTSYKFR
jgi:hypothetical protein